MDILNTVTTYVQSIVKYHDIRFGDILNIIRPYTGE